MPERFYTKIDTPCSADWESMAGDDQIRFCSLCKLNVYNLTEMTDNQVRQLTAERPAKRRCVRLVRRADGSIMTANCPKYLRKVRTLLLKRAPWVLILLSSLTAPPAANAQRDDAYLQPPPSSGQHIMMGAPASIRVVGCADPSDKVRAVAATLGSQKLFKLAYLTSIGTIFAILRRRTTRRRALQALREGACNKDANDWLRGWHLGFGVGLIFWFATIATICMWGPSQ